VLTTLDEMVWSLSARDFDATLLLAVDAKSASDVRRVWARMVGFVRPETLLLDPSETGHERPVTADPRAARDVARLAELLPPNLAALLLIEALCGWDSLRTFLSIYVPPRAESHAMLPRLLIDHLHRALDWFAARVVAAQKEK
jgi:hypothetical protein